MGLPQINIAFEQLALSLAKRSSRGIVSIILKDTTNGGLNTIFENADIPQTLKADNKKFLEFVLKGNEEENKPNKIIAYVISGVDTLDNALEVMETQDFNIMCMPEAIEADKTKIKAFIVKMRDTDKVKVEAILGDTVADHQGIINFATSDVEVEGTKYSSDKFSPRIAGLLAGTPLSQSITYAKLNEVTSIPKITRTDANTAVDAGKLILVKETGAIRIARGVNSLTTTSNDSLKKIKIVSILDLIHSDCKKVIIDEYIGKVPNSYDNKMLLVVAIQNYLKEIAKEQLIQADYTVDVDTEAQRAYLKSKGINVNDMKDQEIREANTGSNVFLRGSVKVLDSVEDVDLVLGF